MISNFQFFPIKLLLICDTNHQLIVDFQLVWRSGLCPDVLRSSSHSPDLLAGFRGGTLKGEGPEWKGERGKGREERAGRGTGTCIFASRSSIASDKNIHSKIYRIHTSITTNNTTIKLVHAKFKHIKLKNTIVHQSSSNKQSNINKQQ